MLARIDTIADTELVIDRSFNAPVALVFRLWSDSDLLKRWFGPKDFTCPSFTVDFRVGGKYRGLIASSQYGDSWFGGTFKNIVPNQQIVMTFAWDEGSGLTDLTDITITFDEDGGVTTQRFHQAPFISVADRDSHVGGWTECLDKQLVYLGDHRN
ncbi:SRPBCC family protein [Pararhizobium sp. PWRC1-1]|uniref:SRPBCC family protein n=1 Tax=Pararhizobium sp. PWRC1-1 TaxID=2804566 RepID=UPI003CEEE114